MNLFSFTAHFTDEISCRNHFKKQRDAEGIVCIKCNQTDHYWLKNKWSYQCKKCSYRTSLRKGTVMENSNLPFLIWYKTMFLMSATKKGFSSKEIQKQLGLKRYEPVWSMVHKLRRVMGKRDDLYTLEGMLELDEGYFAIESSEADKLNQKRGKGSNSKRNVAVMAESIPLENIDTGESSSQCRYFKMKVLETHSSEEINKTVEDSFAERTIVFSDKSTSYIDLSQYVESHITEKSTKETTATTLKWVHIAISNAKRNLLGNYYKIKGKYLQNYLDEFVYKLNRRYFGDKLFDRLIIAGITNTGK
jgi:hypothetical protein